MDVSYPEIKTGVAELGYHNMLACSLNMRERLWFLHDKPSMLKLSGIDILEILNPNGKMNYVGFDMFSRISTEAELRWAVHYVRSCWRHILHPMFTGTVLHVNNAWEKKQINDLFVGAHLSYDVETCRMFFAPYMEDDKAWVLYAFDMEQKILHVMDPKRSCYGVEYLEQHHLSKCIVLLNGMARCIESFFDGIKIDVNEWEYKFHPGLNAKARRNDTGFYVVHYILNFNGKSVIMEMSKVDVHLVKTSMLQLICKMESNKADVPGCLSADL